MFYKSFPSLSRNPIGKYIQSHHLCLPQLKRGIGKDCYLRAIPIEHIDTKFIEKYDKVILSILRTLSLCTEDESLEDYLKVESKPDALLI